MPKKTLVINGHGAKKKEKIQIGQHYSIVTPGNADVSYVLSFTNSSKHLEEMTTRGKIWPITQGGQLIQWQQYQQTELHDIAVSPLQHHFTMQHFANDVLNKKTRWENLSQPPHDVLARGAMAVRMSPTEVIVLEDQALSDYLQKVQSGVPVEGTPIFYCDKELGKVKPLGNTSLSEIYQAVGLINEFKVEGADVIVATCSPDAAGAASIEVQTEMEPLSLDTVLPSKKVSTPDPYVLKDENGDNYVTGIEVLKNGSFKLTGYNKDKEPRFIIIDKHGNATGFNGSKLGIVEKQMYNQSIALFNYFNIPVPKALAEKKLTGAEVKKEKPPYTLIDAQGNNYVTGIEALSDGTYKISGLNNKKESRYIIIDKNGHATGFRGFSLGVVERQMSANRAAVFDYFGIPMPKAFAVKNVTLSSQEKEPFTLSDAEGDNFAAGIEVFEDGSYKINGYNANKAPRYVVVDKNGHATGYNGSKLGTVEGQLYNNREAIFSHFNIPMPNAVVGKKEHDTNPSKKETVVQKAKISPAYTFVCSDETLKKLQQYRLDLISHKATAGKYFAEKLKGKDLNKLTDEQFIECLVQTKPDCIFAEATQYGPALNWSGREISLLGDLSCIIPTKAYDNGAWSHPKVHKDPIDVTLIYVPGPLLASPTKVNETPDLDEVCPGGVFNSEAYYHMLERRLLPGLLHANGAAAKKGEELLITLPGIGCGQFAGNYTPIIHSEFEKAVKRMLTEHGARLTQVKAVWYDNYNQEASTNKIAGIDLLTRPLTKGGLPQLCAPAEYGKQYANCKLVSLVAWDHVSKPGNDYWSGSRNTDDGVKGAATDTMPALTGFEGVYQGDRVVPKEAPHMTWSSYMASKGGLAMKVDGNFNHYALPTPAPDSSKKVKYQAKIEQSLAQIDSALKQLQGKIGKVHLHKSQKAVDTANALLTKLQEARDNYREALFKPNADIKAVSKSFCSQSQKAIDEARPRLEKDLGWGSYLKNLAKSLANAVIWAVTAGNVNSFFTLKKSESIKAVEEVEQQFKNPMN